MFYRVSYSSSMGSDCEIKPREDNDQRLCGFVVSIYHPGEHETIGKLAEALKSRHYIAAGVIVDCVASTAKKLSEEYVSKGRNDAELRLILKKEEALLEDLRKIFIEVISNQLKDTKSKWRSFW